MPLFTFARGIGVSKNKRFVYGQSDASGRSSRHPWRHYRHQCKVAYRGCFQYILGTVEYKDGLAIIPPTTYREAGCHAVVACGCQYALALTAFGPMGT